MSTKISWTQETWNPVTGCTPISPGCQNCYARRMARRLRGRFGYDRRNPFKITSHEQDYERPFKWRKPRMIFVCSMGDLFHKDVPVGCQLGVYETITDDLAEHHTFQILTKRPQIMADFHQDEVVGPLPNLWLGVSCENQEWGDKRIPILLQIPAAVRFVSIEPCLGPIDLRTITRTAGWIDVLNGTSQYVSSGEPRIDWIIIGCESGPGRRECKLEWIVDIVSQCHTAGVPVFVKAVTGKGPGGTFVVKDIDRISNILGYPPEQLRQWPMPRKTRPL
jgi:protein gp37